jgi:DNA-binding MarR family transcriptional regulator
MASHFLLGTGSANHLRPLVRALLEARRMRARYFNAAMFGEPAWDMLLALYSAAEENGQLPVSRLAERSGTPPTTAIRWLAYLEDQGLTQRLSNPNDQRVQLVQLTDQARKALLDYFSDVPLNVDD